MVARLHFFRRLVILILIHIEHVSTAKDSIINAGNLHMKHDIGSKKFSLKPSLRYQMEASFVRHTKREEQTAIQRGTFIHESVHVVEVGE